MTIDKTRTAKIYAFPPRGRMASAVVKRSELSGRATLNAHPRIEFGSGWYHDAAIDEGGK